MIYFDNAATTGHKPQSVINAVNFALKKLSANPGRSGHKASLMAANAVYGAREKIANFFGAKGAETVVFTNNCTEALNFVIKGVLKKGDHAVVSSLEHNAVMRPLAKTGIKYDVARVYDDDTLTLREFEDKITVNTKLVIATGASNVTGKILPIAEIGNICRKRGVYFCVDGAQTAGVLPINMQKMCIDYLCIAPHKGLYSPMGIGVLICEGPMENTVIEGGTGTTSLSFLQPESLPERLESGTLNVPAIVGVSAGIDFVNSISLEKIYSKEMKLITLLYDAFTKNQKIILYTDRPKANIYAPVLPFNVQGLSSEEAVEYFNKKGIALRGGLHCAPTAHKELKTTDTGTLRASVSAFNNENDVLALINAAKNI